MDFTKKVESKTASHLLGMTSEVESPQYKMYQGLQNMLQFGKKFKQIKNFDIFKNLKVQHVFHLHQATSSPPPIDLLLHRPLPNHSLRLRGGPLSEVSETLHAASANAFR